MTGEWIGVSRASVYYLAIEPNKSVEFAQGWSDGSKESSQFGTLVERESSEYDFLLVFPGHESIPLNAHAPADSLRIFPQTRDEVTMIRRTAIENLLRLPEHLESDDG